MMNTAKAFDEGGLCHLFDVLRACGLAEDSDIVGVTAERCDVFVDPLQGEDLIQEAVIAGGVLRGFDGECRMSEKAEDAEAVIDRHDKDAVSGQGSVVVKRAWAGTAQVGSTVDPEHHRQRLFCRPIGNTDVEIETVFAAEGSVVTIPFAEFRLRAGRAICIGVANAGTVLDRYRRTPAEIAHRWFGIRNAKELCASAGVGNAAKLTGGCRDHEGIRRCDSDAGCDERGGQDKNAQKRRNRSDGKEGVGRCTKRRLPQNRAESLLDGRALPRAVSSATVFMVAEDARRNFLCFIRRVPSCFSGYLAITRCA